MYYLLWCLVWYPFHCCCSYSFSISDEKWKLIHKHYVWCRVAILFQLITSFGISTHSEFILVGSFCTVSPLNHARLGQKITGISYIKWNHRFIGNKFFTYQLFKLPTGWMSNKCLWTPSFDCSVHLGFQIFFAVFLHFGWHKTQSSLLGCEPWRPHPGLCCYMLVKMGSNHLWWFYICNPSQYFLRWGCTTCLKIPFILSELCSSSPMVVSM